MSDENLSPTSLREPCGCVSYSISSACSSMSLHMWSHDFAEMTWHVRSTCYVIGEYIEHTLLSREVPVVEPMYVATSDQWFWPIHAP